MSIKLFARNSGAGNGCTNFMGAWDFLALSTGETLLAHKIPRFRGVYFWFFFGRGGSANFIYMGAGIFLKLLRRGLGAFWQCLNICSSSRQTLEPAEAQVLTFCRFGHELLGAYLKACALTGYIEAP